MAIYNLSGIATNMTSPLGFVQGVNNVLTDGLLGIMFLVGCFIVLFISFYQSNADVPRSLSAASFICMIFALLLRAIQLVPNDALIYSLLISALIIAGSWRS